REESGNLRSYMGGGRRGPCGTRWPLPSAQRPNRKLKLGSPRFTSVLIRQLLWEPPIRKVYVGPIPTLTFESQNFLYPAIASHTLYLYVDRVRPRGSRVFLVRNPLETLTDVWKEI
ncbi:hypothetical protein GW17_00055248, partial [Ensete ventricosum]